MRTHGLRVPRVLGRICVYLLALQALILVTGAGARHRASVAGRRGFEELA
jgi:hypothetical protein